MIIDNKTFNKTLIHNHIFYPSGIYYIEEPNGHQMAPDFMLINIFNDKIIKTLKFELKTGKKKNNVE